MIDPSAWLNQPTLENFFEIPNHRSFSTANAIVHCTPAVGKITFQKHLTDFSEIKNFVIRFRSKKSALKIERKKSENLLQTHFITQVHNSNGTRGYALFSKVA